MKKALITIAFSGLLMTACGSGAEKLNEAGNTAFAEQDYAAAVAKYQEAVAADAELAAPLYNTAGVLYRQEVYDQVPAALQVAMVIADETLTQQSHYNLGNSLFKTEDYAGAAEAYKEALRYNPQDLDAKVNLELSLKQLQEQQEQEQSRKNSRTKRTRTSKSRTKSSSRKARTNRISKNNRASRNSKSRKAQKARIAKKTRMQSRSLVNRIRKATASRASKSKRSQIRSQAIRSKMNPRSRNKTIRKKARTVKIPRMKIRSLTLRSQAIPAVNQVTNLKSRSNHSPAWASSLSSLKASVKNRPANCCSPPHRGPKRCKSIFSRSTSSLRKVSSRIGRVHVRSKRPHTQNSLCPNLLYLHCPRDKMLIRQRCVRPATFYRIVGA